MINVKDYFEVIELLDNIDLNIDGVLLKLTQFCEINTNFDFCKCPEMLELSMYDLDERYHKIIEMPEYKKISLLMNYLDYSKSRK